MNPKRWCAVLSAAVLVAIIPTGCATTGGGGGLVIDPVAVASNVEQIAAFGTAAAIRAHPEWSNVFYAAATGVDVLIKNETYDPSEVERVLSSFGASNLRIYVDGAILAYQVFFEEAVASKLSSANMALPLKGLRDGIMKGISDASNVGAMRTRVNRRR